MNQSLTDLSMSISETARRGFLSVHKRKCFYGSLKSYICIKWHQNAQNEFAQYAFKKRSIS